MSVFIIAEAGVNHNGDVETAKKMIDAAVEAGADAIKFQTFKRKNSSVSLLPRRNIRKKTTPRMGRKIPSSHY